MALMHLAPDPDAPWDARAAAHLLRRAGFGASPAEIGRAVEQGREGAVKDLFDDGKDQEAQFQDTFRRLSGSFADFSDAGQLQAWWCYRMLTTRTPLREKLTLFWHGHFATSYHKVEDLFLMHQQCETLRRLAWGNFRDLVTAVSRDPAMLVYLDGESSTKENPNENFARELMELFTLGVGNYTEKDVREAARAFTGWHRDNTKFKFNGEAHDDGDKEFLGHQGQLGGSGVIDVLMAQPALPRFIARKLLVFFACPEPAADVIEEAAEVFKSGQFSVKRFLIVLFQSKFFFGEKCRRTRISSPAECAIGACRSFGVRLAAPECRDHLTAMGQELFGTAQRQGLGRRAQVGPRRHLGGTAGVRAARRRVGQRQRLRAEPRRLRPGAARGDRPQEGGRPARRARAGGHAVEEGAAELAAYLIAGDEGPKPEEFRNDADFRSGKVREAVGLLLSLPEYHA